jgi:hypothetical protein
MKSNWPSQYIVYIKHPSIILSRVVKVVVRQVVHRHLNRNSIAVNVQESSVHEPASISLEAMEGYMGCVQ